MEEQTIKCPNCHQDIPLTEVLTHQIREKVKLELGIEVEKKEKDLEKRETELLEKVRIVENSKKNINEEVNRKLEIEKQVLLKKTLQEAEEKVSLELKDLKGQIQEKDKKIEEAEEKELELRKKQREIEAREKSLELDMARKLDKERKKIEEETSKKISEEQGLKLLEREKIIAGLKKQIDELKRKSEVGSQQLQGEVQELDLESFLQKHFIYDEIRPVPKGIRGADVLQKISTKNEIDCGSMLWESKRAKNWSEGWITKLKEDQREAKAHIAVIVSDILPKDVSNAGFRNGVWITNRASLYGLAMALRKILTEVSFAKLAAEGKDEKVELLFRYLTGPEFKQKFGAMIETFVVMRQDLDKEKRATIAKWGKQEKQIDKIIAVTAGMHGDLRGLIGSSMQSIPILESGEEKEVNEGEKKKDDNEDDKEINAKNIPC